MAGSRRRRELQKRRQRGEAAARREPVPGDTPVNIVERLSPDLLAEVHHQLTFLDRVAFALVCRDSGHVMKPDTQPWLVIPTTTDEKATIFSIADRKFADVPTCDPAMRGHVVVGSSLGWLVTADARGALRLANPVTGAQADLPSIATIPFFLRTGHWFTIDTEAFAQVRFGGSAPSPDVDEMWGMDPLPRTITLTADQMRQSFYRKVVLSSSPRSESYSAMLILGPRFGAPAFATSEDPNWRVAPSRDGIEDAICHDGRFYSLTYSGVVEAWDHDGDSGGFISRVVAPRLDVAATDDGANNDDKRRKYLAVAPDGRFMAVVKESMEVEGEWYHIRPKWTCVFKVHVLDEASQLWEEAPDIGDTALFVGVNSTLCVSTMGYQGIRSNCVYFTDDEIDKASQRRLHRETYDMSYGDADEEMKYDGVYSLSNGGVDKIINPDEHPSWPPPAWFTPSVF